MFNKQNLNGLNISENMMQLSDKDTQGWFRRITCIDSHVPISFAELFTKNLNCWKRESKNYETYIKAMRSKFDVDLDFSANIFNQNLFEQPSFEIDINTNANFFVISGILRNIKDIERVHQFEKQIQKADLSFGCFILPPGGESIQEILRKISIQKLNNLPCSIVLINAQAIETMVPKLPYATRDDSNIDRILQTAICSLIGPVVAKSLICVDFADLQFILNSHKLFGMGVGFLDMSNDPHKTAGETVRAIYKQISPAIDFSNATGSYWIDISGNHMVLTMDHFAAVCNAVSKSIHDDSDYFACFTVDEGLKKNIMVTCFASLV